MRVTVYTTTFCTYCVRAKRLLETRGIPFEEVDVTNDDDRRDWLVQTTKRKTVPQIFIDGRGIGGSDELHAMDRSGELGRIMAAPAPTPAATS